VELFRTTPPRTVCPNFYVLSHANGCMFQPVCTYCYLKSSFWYLNRPHVFTNKDKLLQEVRAWIEKDDLECFVLNSGNLSDSLAFEPERPLVADLVELFREAENNGRPHSLLLVTKAGVQHCKFLLDLPPCRNVIISFSVNCEEAASRLEVGAASPEDRLKAARELKQLGWRVRIRLDPMIAGYDYTPIALEIRRLKPELVTLGSLRAERNLRRFLPGSLRSGLKQTTERGGLDRYPEADRVALYRQAASLIGPEIPIGLCEETREVWEAVLGALDEPRCNCSP